MTRSLLRAGLAIFYAAAGMMHLGVPQPFLAITPEWVPKPDRVVFWTGIIEIVGAAGLAQPWHAGLRKGAGVALALYALCVWPANVNHMLIDFARPDGGLGAVYHYPRMLAQPMLIWLALWVGGATDWPLRRK